MRIPAICSLVLALSLAGCGQLALTGGQGAYTASDGAVSASTAQRMISAYRASHGLSPVTLDPALNRVAQAQARSMAQAGQISHGPRSLSSRLASQGVNPRAAAENVAAGYANLERVMASWRNSSGHNANLLMPQARRMGIALAHAPDSRFKTYWALVVTD